ncbi:TPA: tyrosine--tRNA ligase [Candidatus Nomurabacteria bacterium]|nr:MAG: Tyrosine-tRNA ligase [Candidatus Nomurabacteria bacterium GW2011_GWE2_36_115]KKP93549.1 MAG: Tyrosine-tRNA ligase [Candidatus Nomurabacteria bacterium GW2011_GWF2_36_126]KKP97099.1 MAG: Tyrosine-tRNA ligase [Candidatus Nomurabacteria bacterium GW2011_GWD2_36_14]KKP98899.1 MAG: Tyrosine-tRNA ligase [Candidatus Nomurabacteria bacterium GW2011_GWF2_36_19]KKQ05939.1 MAG: Tyrosine-tRNA ligase [Candidatus Nomurabacteria bacterium GW2011_GWF1_36_47]KKQ08879.1 MAG: Tyrosine-tRNA ligase [Candid
MNKVIVDEKKIDELLTRGISFIYPTKEFLENKIKKGEKLTIYLGIDPTGPTLHLGHAIPIKKLSEFQKAGHQIILLMGDFTAMIGDPTDKGAARKQLTHKEVTSNLKNYKKQASSLISFTGKNPAKITFNSTWLGKMNFEKVISLASNMTVQQMLERDMFEKRMKEGKPIYLHEFLYPLMQGYDSVAMDVDGEIGGNDQTFNMLCGRDLMKTMKNKEKFVITMKLLEDNSGKKMGKTEGNMIALSDSPEEMYGKVMSWTDGMIIPGFELCTNIPTFEIEKMSKDIHSNLVNPKDLKIRLAREIVTTFHNEKKAKEAQEKWENTFSKKEIPEDVQEINAKKGEPLIDVLLNNKIVTSKSDFRRLVDEKAITNLDTDEKVSSHTEVAIEGVYRIGKKRFCKIVIS